MTTSTGNNRGRTCQSCGTTWPAERAFCDCGADLPEVPVDDAQGFEIPEHLQPQQELVYLLDQMLDNPVDKHGNVYDMRYLKPALAFHFARCWPERFGGAPVVKRRQYPNGHVEWVPLDAPDLPPDPLAGLTLDEIAQLPAEQRDAAMKRLQAGADGPVADPDAEIPWKVRTNIQIDEEALQ